MPKKAVVMFQKFKLKGVFKMKETRFVKIMASGFDVKNQNADNFGGYFPYTKIQGVTEVCNQQEALKNVNIDEKVEEIYREKIQSMPDFMRAVVDINKEEIKERLLKFMNDDCNPWYFKVMLDDSKSTLEYETETNARETREAIIQGIEDYYRKERGNL